MISRYFDYTFLNPAHTPEAAVLRACALPVGGPYGVGGAYAAGLCLGIVGGAAANAVWTLDIGGSGTVTFTYTADKVYQTTFAHSAALATVKTALETIFGTGNLTVTGTPGTQYVFTFGGALASKRMGGLVAVSGATPTFTRSTAGSAGAAQLDVYTNGTYDPFRAVCADRFLSDPQGGRVTEQGVTNQSYAPRAYFAGYFKVADLTGLDASAVADPGARLTVGAAITDTGAEIGLGV